MFKKLISLDEAKRIIAKNISLRPVGKEIVQLKRVFNRILAEDLVSTLDVPPFDRSTVDGYTVKAADTFGADEDHPRALKLCGQVRIGESPEISIKKGTTAEIVTGAPLPDGADAVVMGEYTFQKENTVWVLTSVSSGKNVMRAGSDIQKGETVLRNEQMLGPYEIGVLAALGITNVEVYKRPRIAILSTGAEIIEPGNPLPPGKIYDINAHALTAAVIECGGKPINLGIVEDESQTVETTLKKALSTADAVITSGGVSVGPTDIIPKILDKLGKPGVIIEGIAIKPGKPTTVALVDEKPVFSLPGHPTSALSIFQLLVRPLIVAWAKRPAEEPRMVSAITGSKLYAARGRRTFVTVHLTKDESGRYVATRVPLGLSGAITTLSKADGFIEIPETQQFIDEREDVIVHLYKPRLP
ncbi:MAG: molybdopterin-binding protein [Candidatus Bathyarchaeota archaeon]|jgi:putative molybdopterin biosynthesis protein|nr:molybdopterin-binding protein [Candidatus Bathyarchaeota archaeon]